MFRIQLKFILFTIILLLGSIYGFNELFSSDEFMFNSCEKRCSRLTGQGKYRCIKTCLSSHKRSRKRTGSNRSRRFKDCEDVCSVYSGLESIKCIRICLERNKNNSNYNNNAVNRKIVKPKSPCETRCGYLTVGIREKCLAKCKKEKKLKYRDPLRFNK